MNTQSIHTLTSKGQVTIPKKLRDKIGLRPGGQASITLLDDRTIAIKAPANIESIRMNIGAPSNKQPLTQKEKQRLSSRNF